MYNELKSFCQQNDSWKQVSNAEAVWQNSGSLSGRLTMAKIPSTVSGEHWQYFRDTVTQYSDSSLYESGGGADTMHINQSESGYLLSEQTREGVTDGFRILTSLPLRMLPKNRWDIKWKMCPWHQKIQDLYYFYTQHFEIMIHLQIHGFICLSLYSTQ